MEKYIWKVINIIFMTLVSFALGSILIFTLINTKNNIVYYNQYAEGIIISKESRAAGSSDAPSYSELICKIAVGDMIYTSTALKSGTNINIKDQVYCKKKSSGLLKILTVNSEKINNEYGLIDFISLLFSLLGPLILIITIKKKINKK